MLTRGSAKKVTVYVNDDTSSDRNFTYEQVLDLLYQRGLAGATLIRPQEGFGASHRLRDREGQGARKLHLPVRIEFIDSSDTVEAILPELCEIVQDGLIEMQDTTIVKVAKKEQPF
jgi:uncharacterized protein